LILTGDIHTIGLQNIPKLERNIMKNFKVFLIPSAIGLMCLALVAQEPQGRGGQRGAPGAGAGAGGQGAPADAGAGGGQRGGGGPPRGGRGGGRNIQVLGQADLPSTMQSFVQALGLLDKGTCSYCHVEDRSSDEKQPKVVARRMITMMRAINGTFPDGQQHVTCYTCHRGNTKPLMQPEF
jgi:hypothetical protein